MNVTAVIVTNCTRRKAGCNRVDIAQLPESASLVGLAQTWLQTVGAATVRTEAHNLYRGRSIIDAAATAAALNAPWLVVSAGLGLVRSDELVPAYECTTSAGTDLARRLSSMNSSAAGWWNALTSASPAPLSNLISTSPTLLALPGGYLKLVQDDLSKVSTVEAGSLRVFTSSAGAKCVPAHLRRCVMPYDERLESVRGYCGTRTDFAQRALRHFVEVLRATPLSLDEAHVAVASSLANCRRQQRPMGRRMNDTELLEVLEAQWSRHAGSSTRLLRYLRDEARISCEQKRFSRLWQGLSAQKRAQT